MSLAKFIETCRCKSYTNAYGVIMPIFLGSGMKVKTTEALMYGKAIIATDEALTGYSIDGIDGIYKCNSAEEFIDAINNVADKNERFIPEIRLHYLYNHQTEALTRKVELILSKILKLT